MLGTNPHLGIPTDEEFRAGLRHPSPRGEKLKCMRSRQLPEGWVMVEDGTPRTDTEQVLIDLITAGGFDWRHW